MVCSDCVFNVGEFLRHVRKHAVAKELVLCPFKQCAFQSSVASSVSAHLSRKHRTAGIDDLRSEIIADCSAGGTGVELDVEDRVINDNTLDEDEANTASSWSAGEPDLPDSVLTEREFLRLFVKMNTLLHVPRYAVQEIISGLSHINKLSKGGEFNMF